MQVWKLIDSFNVEQYFPSSFTITHAQLPTPIIISPDRVRIYFASRDQRQYSSIYSIDLAYNASSRTFKWLDFSSKALLTPGGVGTFDEHGVYPSYIFKSNNTYYLYYIGWNKGLKPPLFYSSIGLAESNDGITFSKISDGPILGRNLHEPYLVSSPFVEQMNGIFKMYFVSGIAWKYSKDKLESRYDVKSIESSSLSRWSSELKKTVIPLKDTETNIARPWILQAGKDRMMYFCFLSKNSAGYQIGIAREESPGKWTRIEDGLRFEGLADHNSMAYPAVIQICGENFMFLNGNNYGRQGFHIFRCTI